MAVTASTPYCGEGFNPLMMCLDQPWVAGVGSVGHGFIHFQEAWIKEKKPMPPLLTKGDAILWCLPWDEGSTIFGILCVRECRYCGTTTTDKPRTSCRQCGGDL